MTAIAKTPAAPYYAVIFTNIRTPIEAGYGEMAERMVALAAQQHWSWPLRRRLGWG